LLRERFDGDENPVQHGEDIVVHDGDGVEHGNLFRPGAVLDDPR
jgi:hypothetical protein